MYLSKTVTSTLGQGSKLARGDVLKLWQSHHMYLSVTVTATLVQGSKLARGAMLKLAVASGADAGIGNRLICICQ